MNTYSKSTSGHYGHTLEDGNGDFNKNNSDTKQSIAKSVLHMKKGTAASRFAARKRSAAKRLRAITCAAN